MSPAPLTESTVEDAACLAGRQALECSGQLPGRPVRGDPLDHPAPIPRRVGRMSLGHLNASCALSEGVRPNGATPISAGVEVPLADAWTLPLEGASLDFGRSTHDANRSGDHRCGPDNPPGPRAYTIENDLGVVRPAIIRRFGP